MLDHGRQPGRQAIGEAGQRVRRLRIEAAEVYPGFEHWVVGPDVRAHQGQNFANLHDGRGRATGGRAILPLGAGERQSGFVPPDARKPPACGQGLLRRGETLRFYFLQSLASVQVSFLPSSPAPWQSAHFLSGYFFSISAEAGETFVFLPTASVWQTTHFAPFTKPGLASATPLIARDNPRTMINFFIAVSSGGGVWFL